VKDAPSVIISNFRVLVIQFLCPPGIRVVRIAIVLNYSWHLVSVAVKPVDGKVEDLIAEVAELHV